MNERDGSSKVTQSCMPRPHTFFSVYIHDELPKAPTLVVTSEAGPRTDVLGGEGEAGEHQVGQSLVEGGCRRHAGVDAAKEEVHRRGHHRLGKLQVRIVGAQRVRLKGVCLGQCTHLDAEHG